MSTESPFREQDLLARLEALTAERDELSRALAPCVREVVASAA